MRADMHTDIREYFSPTDDYFQYFEPGDALSCLKALKNLDRFVAEEGPFDGVIAYSQGAAIASTLMLQRHWQNSHKNLVEPLFKCAIFLAAAVPCDPVELEQGRIREISYDVDGEVIHVPTTHIWGEHDPSPYPSRLAQVCATNVKNIYVHSGGHEIPGSQNKEVVGEMVRVVKRAISMAQYPH